ncbi:MAG: O-antigen ligase family protein [Gemmatimonadota bacterium]|nr:O-antigen ligase family protein [Gemmatimonadota bacterium]
MVMLAGAWVAPFSFIVDLPVIGLYVHLLHIWTGVAFLVLVATERSRILARIDVPVAAFWTMLCFVILSTVLETPLEYRGRGLVDIRVLFLNVLAFTLMRAYYAARPDAWTRFVVRLGVSSSLMGIVLTVRAVAAGAGGTALGFDSFALGLGTVAGTFTATFAAAAAAVIVYATTRKQLLAGIAAFAIQGDAMVLALARGPWLAFGLAILAAVPLAAWRFKGQFGASRVLMRGLAVLLTLPIFFRIAINISPFIARLLVVRVVEVVNISSGTAFSRLNLWKILLHDAARSPIFGRGAAAYRDISERLAIQGSVSENFVVEMYHAGGIVTLIFLTAGLLGVAYHCFVKPGADRRPALTAACLTGGTALVIASMTNPAAWDGLFWILLGLAATRPVVRTMGAAIAPSAVD